VGAISHQNAWRPSLTQRDPSRASRFLTSIAVGTGHSEVSDFGSHTVLRIGSRSFDAPDSTYVGWRPLGIRSKMLVLAGPS
jgi:hypothetical protein